MFLYVEIYMPNLNSYNNKIAIRIHIGFYMFSIACLVEIIPSWMIIAIHIIVLHVQTQRT